MADHRKVWLRTDSEGRPVQPVQVAVQGIVVKRCKVGAQDIRQTGPSHPVRHGM